MHTMASKQKLSGVESRKSKQQRELSRSAEATTSITAYFVRTCTTCSAILPDLPLADTSMTLEGSLLST